MRKLTLTLTQSGLLAVLLQRQRDKISQLALRHAQREHMRAGLWNTLTWPWRALTATVPVLPFCRSNIPNGSNKMANPEKCDSYDACLTKMVDTLTRRGSNRPIVPPPRALEPAV